MGPTSLLLLLFKNPGASADTSSRTGKLGLACTDTVSSSAKCFSLHVLQQYKVQAALPPSEFLLLMRALYSNPFPGKAHCERNEVNFVTSCCGRAATALLKPTSGQFHCYHTLHPNFPMKSN